jgi:hypothetical protein
LPSIEIRVPIRFSRSVQSKDVNWLPWSVFMISGGPNFWMDPVSGRKFRHRALTLYRLKRNPRLERRIIILAFRHVCSPRLWDQQTSDRSFRHCPIFGGWLRASSTNGKSVEELWTEIETFGFQTALFRNCAKDGFGPVGGSF